MRVCGLLPSPPRSEAVMEPKRRWAETTITYTIDRSCFHQPGFGREGLPLYYNYLPFVSQQESQPARFFFAKNFLQSLAINCGRW